MQLEIFGNIPARASETEIASISIDGGAPTTFTGTAGTETNYGETIFHSPILSQGRHTAVLTSKGPDPLSVDYFLVKPNLSSTPSSSASPSQTESSVPTYSEEPTTPPASLNRSGVFFGAVLGGAFLVLALLGLAMFLCLRRREFTTSLLTDILKTHSAGRARARFLRSPRASVSSPSLPTSVGQSTDRSSMVQGSYRGPPLYAQRENVARETSSIGKPVVVLRPPQVTLTPNPYVDSGIRFQANLPPPSYTHL